MPRGLGLASVHLAAYAAAFARIAAEQPASAEGERVRLADPWQIPVEIVPQTVAAPA